MRFPQGAPAPVPMSFRRLCRVVLAAALAGLLVTAGRSQAQVPTFAPPEALDAAGARTDTHADELPRIASGVAGVWVVVWQVVGAEDLGLGRDIDVVFSRSSDDGEHWSSPRPISESFRSDRAEDRQPAIATDGKGTWIVVWTSTEDLKKTARRDRDIHYAVSTDNALTWSPPRALNSNAATDWGDDEMADIATDGKGRWTVVWQSSDTLGNTKGGDRDILFATSTDSGKSWTAPDVVDAAARTDMSFDTSPRVAVNAHGTWLVAWSSGSASEDRSGVQRGILVARSGDGTSWAPPHKLSGVGDNDRPDWGPRLAGDAHGNWVCAWSSTDGLGETIGHDRDVLFVRSTDDGLSWSERAALNREAADDSGDDDVPELVVDDAGNWIAAWASWDRRGASRGADADLLVAMSRDSGATWTHSYILNSNAKTDHGEDITPSIATDGNGLWIAAWSSTETFGDVLGLDRDILFATGHFGHDIAGPPPSNTIP